jgi:hypothetical protein
VDTYSCCSIATYIPIDITAISLLLILPNRDGNTLQVLLQSIPWRGVYRMHQRPELSLSLTTSRVRIWVRRRKRRNVNGERLKMLKSDEYISITKRKYSFPVPRRMMYTIYIPHPRSSSASAVHPSKTPRIALPYGRLRPAVGGSNVSVASA